MIDWSRWDWKHTVMGGAAVIGAAATAVAAKANAICAAAPDVSGCAAHTIALATTVTAIAGVIVLAFGGASESLLAPKTPPKT